MLLEASSLRDGTGLVFPGKNASGLAAWQLSKLVSNLDLGGTLHGFRTSFRTWAAESGAAREVAEACLAHQVGDATERVLAPATLRHLGHRKPRRNLSGLARTTCGSAHLFRPDQ